MHRCLCIVGLLGILGGLASCPALAQKAADSKPDPKKTPPGFGVFPGLDKKAVDPKAPPKKGQVIVLSGPAGVDVVKTGEKADPKVAKDKLVATGYIPGKLLK